MRLSNLLPLVRNETMKVWKKKRFLVVVLILLVLIPVFTYAQMKMAVNNREKFEDWRFQLQQK